MSSTYGEKLRVTVFGQSHSPEIGVTVEGLPSGFKIDTQRLLAFMDRRAPGKDPTATARKEADVPEFVSGLADGVTCGVPLCAVIKNQNHKSSDYSELRDCPRPGHADYTARLRYGESHDVAGGGHFSGRLTAPLCIAGGIALQLLEREGISIGAHIVTVGKEKADLYDPCHLTEKDLLLLDSFPVRTPDEEERFRKEILCQKEKGDSVGGMIECAAIGVPGGIGDPMFGGMENRIAQIVFGVPAVKGVEFGAGMAVSTMYGTQCNDPFRAEGEKIVTETNNAGGILGGITTGMPLIFRAAIKPTPSIAAEQDSVSLSRMENTRLCVKGRHDPCIVPRAVPVMEACMAIALLDALLCK